MSNQKIVFSKEIDKSLQGFSLVLTFVVMGIMLQFFSSFFGNVSCIVTIVFIIFGLLGFLVELDRIFKMQNLKGSSEIMSGTFLILIMIGIKYFSKELNGWSNIFSMLFNIFVIFFIFLAIYLLFNGIIYFFYSFKKEYTGSKKGELKLTVLKLLMEVLGLVLVILQIIDVLIGW